MEESHEGGSISRPMKTGDAESVGALVFASSYTALGLVRSLGRRGIPVWVLGGICRGRGRNTCRVNRQLENG